MFRVDAQRPVHFCDGLTRRDFLHAGSLTALGLGLPAMQALADSGAVPRDRDVNCILLFLVGGPSQLDTWDMKPGAPEEIRGPFRPIATKVPGIQVSEVFPRLATMMDKVSLVPSVYQTAVRESRRRSLRAAIDGAVGAFEASADARLLDANFEGAFKLMSSPQARQAFEIGAEPAAIRDRYGRTRFGQSCLLARRLIERGVRFVTVNMFDDVGGLSWDIHGAAPFSPISALDTLGPMFDHAFSSLLEDLADRGLLDRTLVVA